MEKEQQARDLESAHRIREGMDDEDAQDEWIRQDRVTLRRARQEAEPEEEDQGAMTYLAEQADQEADRREKRMRKAGLDVGAEEDNGVDIEEIADPEDEEEQGDDLMDEDSE